MSNLIVTRLSEKIAKVDYANPPFNLIVPQTVSSLYDVITELSNDPQIQVVIFTSSVEGYFVNHFDLTQLAAFPPPTSPDGPPRWVEMVLKLANAPFISIGLIRGRTRGGGNELALAMDLRYASQENAFFGQPEVGTGIIPGGGGSERLPRLIGRDRALEVILSSDDYEAATAGEFGWVTRSLPDNELDAFVDRLANRLASFDKEALLAAKAQINRATLPPEADFSTAYREFAASMQWPGVRTRLSRLGATAARVGAVELEKQLGQYLA